MTASMFEVTTRTSRPPGRDDVRCFDVVIRVGGVSVLTSAFTDADPLDIPGRKYATSPGDAEAQARAEFGHALRLALIDATDRVPFR